MFDFSEVRPTTRSEQIRAWCIEQSQIVHARTLDPTWEDVVTVAKMIENYIENGDVSSAITDAVEEGYSEGRFEVKEAVEKAYGGVNLDSLFKDKGWFESKPEKGDD